MDEDTGAPGEISGDGMEGQEGRPEGEEEQSGGEGEGSVAASKCPCCSLLEVEVLNVDPC